MTKVREIYRCQICGNVVEVVNPGAVLSCCGEPMKLMKENTSDGVNLKEELKQYFKISEITPLSTFFDEEWFSQDKQLVYVPA